MNVNIYGGPSAGGGTTPTIEDKLGSDCSGNDNDVNRVLTLSNLGLTDNETLFLDGVQLTPTIHYTISHLAASSTITFIVPVWNIQNIRVIYYV
jgi:hypothetical protein